MPILFFADEPMKTIVIAKNAAIPVMCNVFLYKKNTVIWVLLHC